MRQLTEVQQQWLFEQSAWEHTPSRITGVSLQDELNGRLAVIHSIRSLALRCNLGTEDATKDNLRRVMIVAATLVHRFYMRRSIDNFKEKLMAPTILFLASKIEEETIKLRHIVNHCLDKWDPGAEQWIVDPNDKDNYPQQSREYQAWEREVLAAEEMTLDALCFDMTIESPWQILRRATTSLKSLDGTLDENQVIELGGQLLDIAIYPPLFVMHHSDIIAFGVFTMTLALSWSVSRKEAITAGAEIADKFGLDLKYKEKGADGKDIAIVNAFWDDYHTHVKSGLFETRSIQVISVDPAGEQKKETFSRRFTEPKVAKSNGSGPPKKSAKKSNGVVAPAEEEPKEEVKA